MYSIPVNFVPLPKTAQVFRIMATAPAPNGCSGTVRVHVLHVRTSTVFYGRKASGPREFHPRALSEPDRQ